MRIFLACCVAISALTLVPAEQARWIALGLLVLMFFTPAVGRYASAGRSSGEAVSPRGERGD